MLICKSQASHSDGCTCVTFVVIAWFSMLQSPCVPNKQDIWSRPTTLSPLVSPDVISLSHVYNVHSPLLSSKKETDRLWKL